MCVIEARAADQIELGGWLYPMIKLSKVRRSLIRRWSMMCSSSEKGGSSLPLLLPAANGHGRRDHILQQPASLYIDSSGSIVRMARTSVKADIRAMSNVPVATLLLSSSSSTRVVAASNAATSAATMAVRTALVSYTYSNWESDALVAFIQRQLAGGEQNRGPGDGRGQRGMRASRVHRCTEIVGPSQSKYDSHSSWHVGNNNNGYNNWEQQQWLQQ
jgi:hypothetical protein